MLNTSTWEEKTLNVLNEIQLNPKNVRLETTDAQVEADIIEDLFVNESALGLVESFCKVGLLTHDLPVVIKRGGKYVMVEGNRRLAALKAIQNPQLIPEYSSRVSNFAKELDDRAALASIRVLVAPNQAEADQLVASIHTGNLRRGWSPARQAAFFQAQIDAGRSLKTLVGRYPTIDVRKFVFRALILNEFKGVKYTEPGLRDYLNTKSWARGNSVLARIYESKDFLELTGFSMDKHGKLSKDITNAEFKKLATHIVTQMREGDLNTRTLNTVKSPRFTGLMGELRVALGQDKHPTGNKGGGVRDAGGHGTGGGTKPGKVGSAKPKPSPKPSPRPIKRRQLDLSQIKVPESYPVAVRSHYEELAALDIQNFPNATFLVMRAVLEKSIKAFAEVRNEEIKNKHNSGGWVQLGHALSWLLDYVKSVDDKQMVQPIERVKSGKLVQYVATGDAMNAANHNHKIEFDGDEALAMWGSIDPLLRYVMKP